MFYKREVVSERICGEDDNLARLSLYSSCDGAGLVASVSFLTCTQSIPF